MPVMLFVLFPFAIIVILYSLIAKDKKKAYAAAITSMIITFPIAYVLSSTNVYPTIIILMPLLHLVSAYFINKENKLLAIVFYTPFFIATIWFFLLNYI